MITRYNWIALACLLMVASGVVADDKSLPSVFLVGDSTVKKGATPPGQVGWGDPFITFFDPAKINVINRARGGRSTRTFMAEGHWEKVLAEAKAGDTVIVQFGHNDSTLLDDKERPRGTLAGIGEETQEVENPATNLKETVHTYGWYLRKYVTDAKGKGLSIIVCSPVPRLPKKAVAPTTGPAGYALWAKQVTEEQKVPFVDLESLILKRYADMTPEQIKAKYFTEHDNTHTSEAGARLNAEGVLEGLRALSDSPLVKNLKADAPAGGQ